MIKILLWFFIGAIIGWAVASFCSVSHDADVDSENDALRTSVDILQCEIKKLREENAKLREKGE